MPVYVASCPNCNAEMYTDYIPDKNDRIECEACGTEHPASELDFYSKNGFPIDPKMLATNASIWP